MKLRKTASLLAGLSALLLCTACATPLRSVDLDGSAASIKQSFGRNQARYVMADQSWIFVDYPRDFGNAICGRNICLYKSEVRSVHYMAGGGGVMVDQLVLAPVLLIATIGMIQPTAHGDSKSGSPTTAERMPECVSNTNPSPPSAALASEQALADWAWTNRDSVRGKCLVRASWEFNTRDLRKAVELQMLGVAKQAWDNARCRDVQIGGDRVVPVLVSYHNDGSTSGDVALLWRALEMLADPKTYDDPLSAEACRYSSIVSDEVELEERRRLLVIRLDPFSREPFIAFGKAAITMAKDGEPHPTSNRRLPSIVRE